MTVHRRGQRPRTGRRRRWLGAVAVAVGVLAGCGLPDDRQPRVIAADDAPIDLDQAPNANPPALGGDVEVELYFVEEGQLVRTRRSVRDGSLTGVITALFDGTSTEDEESALSTRIPPDTELVGQATVNNSGVATVELGCRAEEGVRPPQNCGVLGIGGDQQLIVFGQIVCTATSVPGVSGVQFLQSGQPLPAGLPVEPGTTFEPVRCTNYRSLLAPS
jgi:hypothetical protein